MTPQAKSNLKLNCSRKFAEVLLMLLLLASTLCVKIMKKVNFNCSLKNIPTPSDQEYLTKLINSVFVFMSALSWRAFHFLNPSNSKSKDTFGFKTTEAAPSVPELKNFENDMYELVRNSEEYFTIHYE